MLYDNGQLVSLYSDAYLVTKEELYKKRVFETLNFVEKELMGSNGYRVDTNIIIQFEHEFHEFAQILTG